MGTTIPLEIIVSVTRLLVWHKITYQAHVSGVARCANVETLQFFHIIYQRLEYFRGSLFTWHPLSPLSYEGLIHAGLTRHITWENSLVMRNVCLLCPTTPNPFLQADRVSHSWLLSRCLQSGRHCLSKFVSAGTPATDFLKCLMTFIFASGIGHDPHTLHLSNSCVHAHILRSTCLWHYLVLRCDSRHIF